MEPCPYTILDDKVILRGKWLGYREVGFMNPKTKSKGVWQCAFRTTKPVDALVDAVSVIPILKRDGIRYFILVKQYRIPPMGWTVEFPAGKSRIWNLKLAPI